MTVLGLIDKGGEINCYYFPVSFTPPHELTDLTDCSQSFTVLMCQNYLSWDKVLYQKLYPEEQPALNPIQVLMNPNLMQQNEL